MTCRHRPGDPTCSTGNHPDALFKKGQDLVTEGQNLIAEWGPATPDADKYQIIDAVEVGTTLVVKAQYPSCDKCSYEGIKVMVFKNTSAINALKWSRIDPHFSDPSGNRDPDQAPTPCARFPASDEGWRDALTYARNKGTQ